MSQPTDTTASTMDQTATTAGGSETTTTSGTDTSAGAKPDTTDWKAEARKWEERAKSNKTALEQATSGQNATSQQLEKIAELLGLKKGETDPAKLAEQLTGKDAELRQSKVELAVHRLAGKHGGNPDALLDSRSFLASVKDLDPSGKDFAQQVESAIKDAVKANASLKATPTGPAVSGGDFTGGTGAGAPITEEQLSQMSPDDIAKAHGEGKLKHLM